MTAVDAHDFAGRGAVVTGAASGIGFAIARQLADAGAHVALLDVEPAALDEARERLAATGARVCALAVDVADDAAMAAAAEAVEAQIGAVHVLVNNAGVDMAGTLLADATEADWRWILGVNLLGVVHGLRHFLPRIRRHGQPGHVVNTASVAGFFPVAAELGLGAYVATKHAVVGLTESLMQELEGTPVGVSLLVPGTVRTRIATSARNRADAPAAADTAAQAALQAAIVRTGLDPEFVGRLVLAAIRERQPYVFTHPDTLARIQARQARLQDGFGWLARRLEAEGAAR